MNFNAKTKTSYSATSSNENQENHSNSYLEDLSGNNLNENSPSIVNTKYRGEKSAELTKPLLMNPQHFTINTNSNGLNDRLPALSKKSNNSSKSHIQAKIYNFLERPTGW
jgi:hypothetical protein